MFLLYINNKDTNKTKNKHWRKSLFFLNNENRFKKQNKKEGLQTNKDRPYCDLFFKLFQTKTKYINNIKTTKTKKTQKKLIKKIGQFSRKPNTDLLFKHKKDTPFLKLLRCCFYITLNNILCRKKTIKKTVFFIKKASLFLRQKIINVVCLTKHPMVVYIKKNRVY